MKITEVDLYVGSHCKALIFDHLFTAIQRQRFVEFLRWLADLFDQGANDRFGILADQLYQHYVTGMTLHCSCYCTAGPPPSDLAPPDL